MDVQALADRFIDEVKLRAFADRYIDRKEEREILQVATADGVSAPAAQTALRQVCTALGYVLESTAIDRTRELLETYQRSKGRIDEKEFDQAVVFLQQQTAGRLDETQCKRLLIEMVQTGEFKTNHGWFGNWFTKVKQDLGLG